MYFFGVLIAFISPAAHSLSNIFDSYVTGDLFKKIPTTIFYANVTNIFGFVFLMLLGPIHFLPSHLWIFAFSVSFINVAYLFPYYAALRMMDTSIVAALFSLGQIFIPFTAWLIVGEVLQPYQYIGFALVLLSSVILNLNDVKKFKINHGFWLMLFTAVIVSFENVFYKKILQEADWVSTAFWCLVMTFLLRFSIILIKPLRRDIVENFPKYKNNFGKFCIIEIFDQLGSICPVLALAYIPVLVNESISSTQPLFVIFYCSILSKIFGQHFKENLSQKAIVKKILCFILIGVGVNLVIGLH